MGHPGALLAALIPADELQELMDKMDGKGPAVVGARRGKLPGANHTCENGYVKLRFLSDEKEQWAELLQSEYGLQQSWLVLKPMATAIGTGGAAPTGIGGMKVVDLKEELLQLGLDTKGLKAELVRRLTEARRGEEGAQEGPQ